VRDLQSVIGRGTRIVINLSGRGDKDVAAVLAPEGHRV
jgi:tryptophan synthase beta subunit